MTIVIGALETVRNGLERWLEELEIGGQIETIQTIVLLRSAKILRKVLETRGDSDSSAAPSAATGVKNLQEVKQQQQ